jgi:hypothetical protein
MGDDVLVVQVLQTVEDARIGPLGILLDVQDGAEVIGTIGGIDREIAGLGREHMAADRQVVLIGADSTGTGSSMRLIR